MSTSRSVTPSRRGLLAAGGAARPRRPARRLRRRQGLGGRQQARQGAAPGPSPTTARRSVTSRHTPQRIVAFTGTAAALHDFGIDDQIVGVFGPTKLKNGKPDPQAGDLDVDKVDHHRQRLRRVQHREVRGPAPRPAGHQHVRAGRAVVRAGREQGEDPPARPQPSPSPRPGSRCVKIIERYAELAESLGADLKAKKVTDAKARFEKASAALRKAAKSHPVKVLACSGSPDLFYASNPGINADLQYYKDLGVDLDRPRRSSDKRRLLRGAELGERRQVQGRRPHAGQPHRHPPAQGPGRQAHLGEAARRQGRPGHPLVERAALLLRGRRAAHRGARQGDRGAPRRSADARPRAIRRPVAARSGHARAPRPAPPYASRHVHGRCPA